MKPTLLKLLRGPGKSFSVRRDTVPYINNCWHYHSEVELIHFKKGEGTQFIGDSISRFKTGDIVLVGTNLPHYWRFDDLYFEEPAKAKADVTVVHFNEDFWGTAFLDLPENMLIKSILEKAKRGVKVNGKTRHRIAELIDQLLNADGSCRIVLLMQALQNMADSKQNALLSSIGFQPGFGKTENERINAIYEYSLLHFKKTIPLAKIAGIVNMSPHSFCRYFKSRTKKTYSQFLAELRIGHACKLLIENKISAKQICYESGFNNFTSFHSYFKRVTGKSPLVYQKGFVQLGDS